MILGHAANIRQARLALLERDANTTVKNDPDAPRGVKRERLADEESRKRRRSRRAEPTVIDLTDT